MLNRAQTMGRHAEFEATLKLFADQRHVLKVGKEDTLSLVVGVANIVADLAALTGQFADCLLYTSPSPRDQRGSRMPSSA